MIDGSGGLGRMVGHLGLEYFTAVKGTIVSITRVNSMESRMGLAELFSMGDKSNIMAYFKKERQMEREIWSIENKDMNLMGNGKILHLTLVH